MEEKLLTIFKLADSLNDKQDKVFAQIRYSAVERKSLEIAIRSKQDFSFIERCEIYLQDDLAKWDRMIQLLDIYVGGN